MKLASLLRKINHFKATGIIQSLNPFAQLKRKTPLLLLAVLLIFQCTGCQDTGIVGSGLPGTSLDVVTDTFRISGTQSVSLESFSGGRAFISAGEFQDPLFGDMRVIGLLKPGLISKDTSFTFDQDTEMKLQLFIHTKSVYGDTAGSEKFKIVPIGQVWRGEQRKTHEKIKLNTGSTIRSFAVDSQDTMIVPLPEAFLQNYLTFYQKSGSSRYEQYRTHFNGFALVPQNSQKIVTFNPRKSRLLMIGVKIHTDSTVRRDTVAVNFSDWAYSLQRSGSSSVGSNSTKIFNTLANILRLNIQLPPGEINPRNISKAELVIFQNTQKLKSSIASASPDAVRSANDTLSLYFAGKHELLKALDSATRGSIISATYHKDDHSYHFFLSGRLSWIFNSKSGFSLYLLPNENSGIIRTNLLFNSHFNGHLQPKIIITHTNSVGAQ